jgi:hypothetical protein
MSQSLDWMDRGACVGHPNPDLFFPSSTGKAARRQAQEAGLVCATCPVQTQCQEHRKNTGAAAGIWGGSYHRTKPAGSKPHRDREHGTDKGYDQHRTRGETPCERCRFAHALTQRKRAS